MGAGKVFLITTAGVLLVLSHAAVWRLGQASPGDAASGSAPAPAGGSTDLTDHQAAPAWSPAELVRMGRGHEAAALAAEQAEREEPIAAWEERVAAARAKLAPDADFPALVREGMAAVKFDREGPAPETAAAFGKWLEMDPDVISEQLSVERQGRKHRTSKG